jgi:hypothetical protein
MICNPACVGSVNQPLFVYMEGSQVDETKGDCAPTGWKGKRVQIEQRWQRLNMRRRRSTRARDKTSRDMNEVDTGDGKKGITMTSKAHWATAERVDLPVGNRTVS